MSPPPSYLVRVDYAETLADLISAGGFTWEDPSFHTENNESIESVPNEGVMTVVVELIAFDRVVRNEDEVITALARIGYRPADIAETLAFAANHPESLRNRLVACFGTTFKDELGCRCFTYLSGKKLVIRPGFSVWGQSFSFPAVRKIA